MALTTNASGRICSHGLLQLQLGLYMQDGMVFLVLILNMMDYPLSRVCRLIGMNIM